MPRKIAYTVSYYSVKQNKSHTVIYLMNADGTESTMLTTTADNETEPAFTPDGNRLTFLSNRSGSNQIWEMALDGTARRQLSFCDKDVEGYKFSPDGKKVILVHSVDTYASIEKPYDDLPLASGMVITDLNFKHWDHYVKTIPHIFLAEMTDGRISEGKDILEGEPFECPMLPLRRKRTVQLEPRRTVRRLHLPQEDGARLCHQHRQRHLPLRHGERQDQQPLQTRRI